MEQNHCSWTVHETLTLKLMASVDKAQASVLASTLMELRPKGKGLQANPNHQTAMALFRMVLYLVDMGTEAGSGLVDYSEQPMN